ncbi:MAG TPA: class I SAM-dependent methyltransferase [Candidatus Limnocylindrales bacterium]
MILDLGTGDGRAVLKRAAMSARALVIGLDPVAAAMAEASRRAARSANVLFVRGSAEAPPAELVGRADEVTVLFPWGSLLRGVLGLQGAEAAADGMASLLRPGGRLTAMVSVTDRDGGVAPTDLDVAALTRLASVHAGRGLRLCDARPATPDEIRDSGSTWARRLGATAGRRPAWRLEFERG